MMCRMLLLYMCTLFVALHECSANHLGHDVAEELAMFANDGLGVQAFQNYLDRSVTFVDEDINGTAIVKQIAEVMSEKLQIRIDALTDMKDEIEKVYDTNQLRSSNPFRSCCTVDLEEKDPLLNTEVNYDKLCTVGQEVDSANEFLPSSITDVIRTQYQKALGIKYAFFGTEEGVMFNYPALRVCQDSYDPRFRPWYVETASPEPKDLVIIIDRSGSMTNIGSGTRTRMEIAISAALTVIETLNPNDRVGVVAFSNEAETPSGLSSTSTCYRDNLAKATSENKDYLNSYIRGIQANGNTYYNKALDAAFTYFNNAEKTDDDRNLSEERDKVILFLTDGGHTEADPEDIYDKIAFKNSDLGNEVVILTYGLGIKDETVSTVLENMAKQIKNDIAYGDITEGIYEPVTDPDNLRSAMASYYDQFLSGNQNIIFSVPYLDAFGTGLLISMCLPVSSSGDFKGVTCMDLAVDDLLADITYFREGETSYAFIIDEYGRVLTHPLLPNPSEITNNPLFIYISALETVKDIDAIRNSMISGDSGVAYGTTRVINSRGNVQLEGVLSGEQQATYSWHPISGSGFSICLVVGDGDKRTSIQWSNAYPDYTYHRLDLVSGLSTCRTFDRVAVRDSSSVMFAARAFEDPFGYLYGVETVNDVTGYDTYLKGGTFNPGFKEGVRETLAVTAEFEALMSDPQNNYNMYSVWRYVSTDNGIHRIYPGVRIPKNYDPTQRTWYLRAKAYKGSITMSTPYVDAFGAGIVVTLSQAIYEGKVTRQHTPADRAIAVMGVDFTLQYFYNLVTSSITSCDDNTCLVLDSAGFIVAHKDWITPSRTSPETANVHVADKEPFLANRLKAENLMKYSACVNVEELRDQYFWTVSIPGLENGLYETSDFEMHEVENTNIFLVILKNSFSSASCDSCGSVYIPCQNDLSSASCFCPCYSSADIYRYCLGEFDFGGDDNPPCSPPVPEVSFTDVNAQDADRVGGLSECYDYRCEEESKRTDEECNSVILCSWCEYDKDAEALSEPYCTTTDVCPGGYLATSGGGGTDTDGSGTTNSGGGGDDGSSGGSQWWIAIIIIIAIAIAAVIGFFIYKKKMSSKKSSGSNSQPPPPSASAASGGRMQGFDNLAMVYTDGGYPTAKHHMHPPPPPQPMSNPAVAGNMQGYDNKAMVYPDSGYLANAKVNNRPQAALPPGNNTQNYDYTNPVAYGDKSMGQTYEVPQSQYESLNYHEMSSVQQKPSAPYVAPPAYGSAH